MTYNLSSIDNGTGLTSFFSGVNTAANGLPATLLIVVLWLGTFIFASSKQLNPGESFTITNFLMVIISALFYFAGMLNINIVITLIVLFFIGIGYLMFK